MTTTSAMTAYASGRSSTSVEVGDLVDDLGRPAGDAQPADAVEQAAEQPLPDQQVDQPDDHGVPGHHREQREERAVRRRRRPATPSANPTRERRATRRSSTSPATSIGSAPKTSTQATRDDELAGHDRVAGDRLGQQVGDRAVVDLGRQQPGRREQRDQRARSRPARGRRACPRRRRRPRRRAPAPARESPTSTTGSTNSRTPRQRPKMLRTPSRTIVGGDDRR